MQIRTGTPRELAHEPGARLTLVARRTDLLERLSAEIEAPVHVVGRDLSELDPSADEWLERAEAIQGPIDVLVNNAGMQVIAPTASVDIGAGEALLRLDLATPLRLIARALPGMLSRKRGQIVNIASMAALAPTPGMTYYNASKAGLAAASEALRWQPTGSARELAAAIRRSMAKRDARLVYPRVYGFARWFPTLVRILIDWFSPRLIEQEN